MSTALRRIRGLLGIALTWAVAWGGLGALATLVIGYFRPGNVGPGEGPLVAATVLGIAGFVSGVLFGGFLSAVGRRKTLLELSLARMAIWGAVAASVIPLVTIADDRMVYITAPLGAFLASGSLALARRVELGKGEERKLLT